MPKQEGWFSKRYKTSAPHHAAQVAKAARVARGVATMIRNGLERAARSPREQLAVLDSRLGSGRGAKRERQRLKATSW